MKREDAIFCQNCKHFIQLFSVTTNGAVVTSRYGLCNAKKEQIQDSLFSVECCKFKQIEYNPKYDEEDIRAYTLLHHYLKKTLVHLNRYFYKK
ncbi:MAG: hypothetical protein K2G31_03650 [Clostridia bacterium]|nr:hypothetical protein [Clostridia bacterium]